MARPHRVAPRLRPQQLVDEFRRDRHRFRPSHLQQPLRLREQEEAEFVEHFRPFRPGRRLQSCESLRRLFNLRSTGDGFIDLLTGVALIESGWHGVDRTGQGWSSWRLRRSGGVPGRQEVFYRGS